MPNNFISQEGSCSVVKATKEHALHIAKNIRKIDELEVACIGATPINALLGGLKNDYTTLTALTPEDEPMAMFGVGEVGEQAYIWCLGTPKVVTNGRQFLKSSRKWVKQLTKPYGVTFNYIHEDNKVALKWLKYCGAVFIKKLTINSHPFLEFVIPIERIK